MKTCGILCFKLSLLVLLFLPAPSSMAYEATAVTGGGSIVGTVKFQGTAPAPKKVTITRDKKVCGKEAKFTESLRGQDSEPLRSQDLESLFGQDLECGSGQDPFCGGREIRFTEVFSKSSGVSRRVERPAYTPGH